MLLAHLRRQVAREKIRHVAHRRSALGELPVDDGDRAAVGEIEEHIVEPIVGMRDR